MSSFAQCARIVFFASGLGSLLDLWGPQNHIALSPRFCRLFSNVLHGAGKRSGHPINNSRRPHAVGYLFCSALSVPKTPKTSGASLWLALPRPYHQTLSMVRGYSTFTSFSKSTFRKCVSAGQEVDGAGHTSSRSIGRLWG